MLPAFSQLAEGLPGRQFFGVFRLLHQYRWLAGGVPVQDSASGGQCQPSFMKSPASNRCAASSLQSPRGQAAYLPDDSLAGANDVSAVIGGQGVRVGPQNRRVGQGGAFDARGSVIQTDRDIPEEGLFPKRRMPSSRKFAQERCRILHGKDLFHSGEFQRGEQAGRGCFRARPDGENRLHASQTCGHDRRRKAYRRSVAFAYEARPTAPFPRAGETEPSRGVSEVMLRREAGPDTSFSQRERRLDQLLVLSGRFLIGSGKPPRRVRGRLLWR